MLFQRSAISKKPEEMMLHDPVQLRQGLEVAHIKLNASRALWLIAYPTQSHKMLFDAQARAFAAFGCVPRRGIYDNMKTADGRSGTKQHYGAGRHWRS
jgi:transposase